jgi:helix-turn-helix protein
MRLQFARQQVHNSEIRTATRSFRIRAYPNGAQRRLLDRWLGVTRWLWNRALEIRCEAYRECGLTLTGNDISRWLSQWKRTPGHEWLAQVPATCLTQCLRDQDAAFRNFFAHRARSPRFKGKTTSGSVRFQDVGVAWARGLVTLPKLGALRLAESLPEVERPDLVTLSRDAAGRYHVSFCAQVQTSLLPITHRVVHARKRFWSRCSQRKREAGDGIEPVWNRQASVSSAVKLRCPRRPRGLLTTRSPPRCLRPPQTSCLQ